MARPYSISLVVAALAVTSSATSSSLFTSSSSSSGCAQPRSSAFDMAGGPYALLGEACAVHDPAIAVEDGKIYIFSTDTGPQPGFEGSSLLVRCVDAATNTTLSLCDAILPNGLDSIPWYKQYAPTATNVWAPDVSYFSNLWHVYYAVSEFGKPNSVLGLATRSSLDPASNEIWADQGPIYGTNGTQGFNAIDPSIVFDENGDTWMVLGSFWDGIQLFKVTSSTGQLDLSVPRVNIANRQDGSDALEGAFLVYRKGDEGSGSGFYYLFVSWNTCCQGTKSNYEVRMGRSKTIEGPYLDESGASLMEGGGTHLLGGKNSPPTLNAGWAAGGGESILRETLEHNVSTMVVHGYDGVSGDPWVQIIGLYWNSSNVGWPTVVPT